MIQRTVETSCALLTFLLLSGGLYVVASTWTGSNQVQPINRLAYVSASFTN